MQNLLITKLETEVVDFCQPRIRVNCTFERISQKVRNCVTSPLNLRSVSFGNFVRAVFEISVPVPEFP